MHNIVFNATRQWNCGDEFILFGVMNIFNSVGIKYNPIIYNRNPDIRPVCGITGYRNFQLPLDYNRKHKLKYLDAYLRLGFHDNSIKFNTDCSFVQMAVIAGSPENTGWRNINFFEHILKNKLPLIALGIGFWDDCVSEYEKEIYKNSLICTVRDKKLLKYKFLQDINAIYLPCPAFLSAPLGSEKNISNVKNIGLNMGAKFKDCVLSGCIKDKTFEFCVEYYSKLIENYSDKYNFSIVCHYIDELPIIHKIFAKYNIPILYSFDAKDYFSIYSKFDFCISSRVHACGISSSLGIPNINIAHDERATTTEGFLSTIISDETTIEEGIRTFEKSVRQASNHNKTLLKHKKDTLKQYTDLLKNKMSFDKVNYSISKFDYPFEQIPLNKMTDILASPLISVGDYLCMPIYRFLSHITFGYLKQNYRKKYKTLKAKSEGLKQYKSIVYEE